MLLGNESNYISLIDAYFVNNILQNCAMIYHYPQDWLNAS